MVVVPVKSRSKITLKYFVMHLSFCILYSGCKVIGGSDYWNQILGLSSTASNGHLDASDTHTRAKHASRLVSWAGASGKS